jgi:hypothetical protein
MAHESHGEWKFLSVDVPMVYLVATFGDFENYVATEGLIGPNTEPSPGMSIFSFLLQHKQYIRINNE